MIEYIHSTCKAPVLISNSKNIQTPTNSGFSRDELGKHYAVNNPDAKRQILCDEYFIEAENREVASRGWGAREVEVSCLTERDNLG